MLVSDPVNYWNFSLTRGLLTMKIPNKSNRAYVWFIMEYWSFSFDLDEYKKMMDLLVSSVRISADLYKQFSLLSRKWNHWHDIQFFILLLGGEEEREREREREERGGGGVCLAKHIKICAVVMITEILCAYYEMCNCIWLHPFLYFLRNWLHYFGVL